MGVYSEGKKRLLEEKLDIEKPEARITTGSITALSKAAAELKANLPELQDRIQAIERLEERYLLRKADLKGIDASVAGFTVELNALAIAVRRIADSVEGVEEYNRQRKRVLDKLEQVLDGYGVFVKAISDFEKQ